MRSLSEILSIIEIESIAQYGSINKMLIASNLSKSVIDNMKRKTPSIPSVDKLCKIAESLDLSLDYFLMDTVQKPSTVLSSDEKYMVDMFRELDNESQEETLDFIKFKHEKIIKKAKEKLYSSTSPGYKSNIA